MNPEADPCKRPALPLRKATPLHSGNRHAENDLISPAIVAPGLQSGDPSAQWTLSGPSRPIDPLRRPVRGDLAHVRCAGQVFVPHYAVPMPRAAGTEGATLRKAARVEADSLLRLAPGEIFNVLDIAGLWAWGQQGEDGYVGYVALAELEAS